jgi:3',5'-cyclic AMP phosphodiesterase CpdA
MYQGLMRIRTLAHLSDLHFGLPARETAAAELVRTLCASAIDHVVVTGDITQRGKRSELDRFRAVFAPLLESGRMTLIPGNHDRWNAGVASEIMSEQVDVCEEDGLYLVRTDSSGPQNENFIFSHGSLCEETIERIGAAFDRAPAQRLRVLLLHHHVLPLPEESFGERIAAFIGWPHVGELHLGERLLERLRGRCDLVLHGHRHVPRVFHLWPEDERPLGVYNAGCSTELLRMRVFSHAAGQLLGSPIWLDATVAREASRAA